MKLKKLLLPLGALTTVIAPTIALTSCAPKGSITVKTTRLFSNQGPLSSSEAISVIASTISDLVRVELTKDKPMITDQNSNPIPIDDFNIFKKRFTNGRVSKKNNEIPWYEIWTLTSKQTVESLVSDPTTFNAITVEEYQKLDEKKVNAFPNIRELEISYYLGPCNFQKNKPYVKVIKPTKANPLYKVSITLKNVIVIQVNPDLSKDPKAKPNVFIAFKGIPGNIFDKSLIKDNSLTVEIIDGTTIPLPGVDELGYKFN